MRFVCKSVACMWIGACCLLASFAVGPDRSVSAAEPMAVVSISSIQTLLDDVTYVTEAAGVADAGKMAVMMARPYTAGIDKTRPIGFTVDAQFRPLVFLPVEDLKTTLSVLKEQIGEPQDAGNGMLELNAGPMPVYLKEQQGWVFLAQTTEGLSDLPADPVKLLGTLPNSYDVAVRAFVQRVPAEYREMALSQLKTGAEEGLRKKEDESDESYQARRKMVEDQLQQMTSLINETEEVTVGLRVAQKSDVVQLDFLISAIDGSRMARQFQTMADAETRFSSLVKDDAAFRMLMAAPLADEDVAQAVSSLEAMRGVLLGEIDRSNDIPDSDTRDLARDVAGDLMDVLVETIRSGKMDMAATVSLVPRDVNVAVAAHVADPKRVEATLKKVLDWAQEKHGEVPPVKWNAAQHADVTFHQVSVPIPADEASAQRVFGSSFDMAVGIGKESVFFSVGARGMEQVKAAIDLQGTAVELKRPFQMILTLTDVLNFAQSVKPDEKLAMMLDQAGDVKGRDRIRIILQPIPRGAGYRIEVEKGVIELGGKAAQVQQAQQAR